MFIRIVSGERGLSYTGTRFHRVLPGLILQGGDIQNGDGTGQVSIYGETFDDESFDIPHDSPGNIFVLNYVTIVISMTKNWNRKNQWQIRAERLE